MIAEVKIDNPYNIAFNLDYGRNDIISGTIFIDDVEHFLDVISNDILTCLKAVVDSKLSNLFPYDSKFDTIDDIPECFRIAALEVKLKLMACRGFQKMDSVSQKKFQALEQYQDKREKEENRHQDIISKERIRHKNALINIERWLDNKLEEA